MKRLMMVMVALATMSVYLTGCPGNNKGSTNPPVAPGPGYGPYGQNCQPGQYCPPGGYGGGAGAPLLSGPTFSALDYQGSTMSLVFTSAQPVNPGQNYVGPVQITGSVRLNRNCGYMPPGEYPVQGQGNWVSGYGNSIARVEGQLQMQNGGLTIYSALITTSSNNNNGPTPPGVYSLQGTGMISNCGPFTAL